MGTPNLHVLKHQIRACFFFFFLVWYGKNKMKETKPRKIAVTFLGKKPGCEKDFNYGGGIQTCIYLVSTKKIIFLKKNIYIYIYIYIDIY